MSCRDFDDESVSIFIESVRSHPCLYDKSHEDFLNIKVKRQIWRKIAEETAIRNGDVARARWRNLKDSYMKFKRANTVSGRNIKWAKTYAHYRWAIQMSFLDPQIGTTPARKRIRPSIPRESKLKSNNSKETASDDENRMTDDDHRLGENEDQSILEPILTFSEESQASNNSDETERDATYYLFMSYAAAFRKFSPVRQAMFKMALSQLFAGAELEQLIEDKDTKEQIVFEEEESNSNKICTSGS